MKIEWMPHQLQGELFFHETNEQCIWAWRMGTGKTFGAIKIASAPNLVICGTNDIKTWIDHLRQWYNVTDGISFKVRVIDSAKSIPKFHGLMEWTIVTYGLLRNKKVSKWIKAEPFKTVIADEIHNIKRMKSAQTKAAIRSTRHIHRRLGLSGTPITNQLEDVFSICLFIDGGKTFGKKWWHFMQRYYIQPAGTPGWYIKRGSKEIIEHKLKSVMMHVHEDDVLKLPPTRELNIACPMSDSQSKHYNNILKEWETMLEDGTDLELTMVTVQISKLKQIASGFLYDEKKYAHHFACRKLDKLILLLRTKLKRKKKIVIWCSFTAEIDRVMALIASYRLGNAVRFAGANKRQKIQARERFATLPSCRFFVGQVDSGVGMNDLIIADTAIYVSKSFKVVSDQQSRTRTRRKGSEIHELITYISFYTKGTVEEKLNRSIKTMVDFSQSILSKLKQGVPLKKVLK